MEIICDDAAGRAACAIRGGRNDLNLNMSSIDGVCRDVLNCICQIMGIYCWFVRATEDKGGR